MKNHLSRLDRNLREILKTIGQKADQKGVSSFVVGGFVRDLFLKKTNLDCDVVIESDAVAFAQEIAKDYNASLIVFSQFGTATMILPQGYRVDLATARKESYPQKGALPVVWPGSIHEDLFRRDFTINAMAMRINPNRFGELVDDFKGLRDLRQKKIRILHDESFRDDPTRILRAVRFEQRFNFHIERHSFHLLKSALKEGVEDCVKPQRYFEEFKKILAEERPQRSIHRLYPLGGLNFLGAPLKDITKTVRLMKKMEETLVWFRKTFLDKKPLENWLAYFMVLADDFSEKQLRSVLKRFNLKKNDRVKLLSCRTLPSVIRALRDKSVKPSWVYQVLKPLSYEAILFLKIKALDRTKAKAFSQQVAKWIDGFLLKYDSVRLNVNGNELKALGIPQGPSLGKILKALLYAKIDGFITTHQEELKHALKLVPLIKA